MGGESLHEGEVDAGLLAFHIDGVHEVFGATGGESFQRGLVDGQFSKILPAIGDHPILAVALAAGKIEHEAFAANGFYERGKAFGIEAAFAENPRGDDDVRRAGIEPTGGVIGIHAAAELEAVRKCGKGFARRRLIAGAKLNDVTAAQVVLAIQLGVPGSGTVRNKVSLRPFRRIGKRAADNLFHPSFVQINAGAEHGGRVRRRAVRVES